MESVAPLKSEIVLDVNEEAHFQDSEFITMEKNREMVGWSQ